MAAILSELDQQFRAQFDSEVRGDRSVGIELEFPIVTSAGEAPSYEAVRSILETLQEESFTLQSDAHTGAVVLARSPSLGDRASFGGFDSHVVSLELGYCTLEISLAPERTLFLAEQRLGEVLAPVLRCVARHKCSLLGYGIQPSTPPSRRLVAPKQRYLHYPALSSNDWLSEEDGEDIHLFTVAAASQCHVKVSASEAVRVLNVLNALAGVQLALTANSSVWRASVDPNLKAVRERMYDWVFDQGTFQAISTKGVAPTFRSLSDYTGYLCRLRATLVQRGAYTLRLPDDVTVGDFFERGGPLEGTRLDGGREVVVPRPEDLYYFAALLEFNARLSPSYGTVESRVSCQQPPNALLSVPALVLGLVENLAESEALADAIGTENFVPLRFAAMTRGLHGEVGEVRLDRLAEKVLSIASAGLGKRGLGEDVYLEALWRRLSDGLGPADRAAQLFEHSGLGKLVEEHAIRLP